MNQEKGEEKEKEEEKYQRPRKMVIANRSSVYLNPDIEYVKQCFQNWDYLETFNGCYTDEGTLGMIYAGEEGPPDKPIWINNGSAATDYRTIYNHELKIDIPAEEPPIQTQPADDELFVTPADPESFPYKADPAGDSPKIRIAVFTFEIISADEKANLS